MENEQVPEWVKQRIDECLANGDIGYRDGDRYIFYVEREFDEEGEWCVETYRVVLPARAVVPWYQINSDPTADDGKELTWKDCKIERV